MLIRSPVCELPILYAIVVATQSVITAQRREKEKD